MYMAAARKEFSKHSNLSASAVCHKNMVGYHCLGDAEIAASYWTYHILWAYSHHTLCPLSSPILSPSLLIASYLFHFHSLCPCLYICVSTHVYMCVHVCGFVYMSAGSAERVPVPWSWTDRQLWAASWGFSVRALCTLNPRTISPAIDFEVILQLMS